jgi:hypothetical protein
VCGVNFNLATSTSPVPAGSRVTFFTGPKESNQRKGVAVAGTSVAGIGELISLHRTIDVRPLRYWLSCDWNSMQAAIGSG